VSGRNLLSWQDRFRTDLEYVERRSLGLDLRILLRTIEVVIRREGVSSGSSVTMEAFRGNDVPNEQLRR